MDGADGGVHPRFGMGVGRHTGKERVERSEERVPQFCLSEFGSGTGGAWVG